MMEKFKAAVIW